MHSRIESCKGIRSVLCLGAGWEGGGFLHLSSVCLLVSLKQTIINVTMFILMKVHV